MLGKGSDYRVKFIKKFQFENQIFIKKKLQVQNKRQVQRTSDREVTGKELPSHHVTRHDCPIYLCLHTACTAQEPLGSSIMMSRVKPRD